MMRPPPQPRSSATVCWSMQRSIQTFQRRSFDIEPAERLSSELIVSDSLFGRPTIIVRLSHIVPFP